MESVETNEIIVPIEDALPAGAILAGQRRIVTSYCRWQPCGIEMQGTTRKRFCSLKHQRKHWRMRKQRALDGIAEAID